MSHKPRLAECPICTRGHKVPAHAVEPSHKDNTELRYYRCPDCGVTFRKWWSVNHVGKAADALAETDLPVRTREKRDPYSKAGRKKR